MSHLTTFGIPLLSPDVSHNAGRAFAEHLERQYGDPIRLVVPASYSELADGLAEGRIDFGWLPPVEAYLLSDHTGVELLLQAKRGGKGHYFALVFVRADSELKSFEDLSGKRVGYVHRRSASGYLMAATELRRAGIVPAEPAKFLGSHGRVVEAVISGEVDAGSTYGTLKGDRKKLDVIDAGWLQLAPDKAVSMRCIGAAGPIPTDTICAWLGTSRGSRTRLIESFAALGKKEETQKIMTRLFGTHLFVEPDGDAATRLARALLRQPRPDPNL